MVHSETGAAVPKHAPQKPSEAKAVKHTNHLVGENSPYLLSHAHNPVDWYPWGPEALDRARKEDKPIFLSIGYAACHWCHVMERESFENEAVAALLNKNYIAIKVDREQRPDLDQIYMAFTTAMTGSGGWPMSVFLTPELKPFYAGTYFPAVDSYGRPSFTRLITEIATAYRQDKAALVKSSEDIFRRLNQRLNARPQVSQLSRAVVDQAASELMRGFDRTFGGFGSQPKFPHAPELSLFLRHYRTTGDAAYLAAAEKSLTAMARGGIFDHLGGGFARYSTDRKWLVPHFEKMLYDNGLLIPVYVEAWQITRNDEYLKVVRRSLDWLLREMTDSSGGFYSTLDADSEGEEGKFYVWSKKEIEQELDASVAVDFMRYYNVTAKGNFEGHNILNVTDASVRPPTLSPGLTMDDRLTQARQKLLTHRAQRIRPLTDDKILTSWNGLALTAFCRGFQATGDRRYLDAAIKNATFVSAQLWRKGKLTHAYREGIHSKGQFLEDYAYYVKGLLDLYESDPGPKNERWLKLAVDLAGKATTLFMDVHGTMYLRPPNQADLIMRPLDERDGAIPAPGSIMITNLLKLNRLTGEAGFLATGEKALKALSGKVAANPSGYTAAVLALDYYLSDKIEIVVVGPSPERDELLAVLYKSFIPNRTIAFSADGKSSLPLFEGRSETGAQALAYVCRNSVCRLPAESSAELENQLGQL